MRVVVYGCGGRLEEVLDDALVPRPGALGTLYLVYEGLGLRVVTRLERGPGGERERVVSVATRRGLRVFEELPRWLAEELGLGEGEAVGRRAVAL